MAVRAYETKQGTRWAAIVRDEHGKQVWRRGFKTEDAALKEAKRLLRKREKGVNINPERMTFEAFTREYLERKKTQVATNTWIACDQALRLNAVPVIGRVRLNDLKAAHLQMVVDSMRRRGLAASTINTHLIAIKSAVREAYKLEMLERDPTEAVKGPRAESRQVPFLEPAEVERLLEQADKTDFYAPIVRLALATGLRRGELLALTWDDVDLGKARLRVARAKTSAGKRTLTLGQGAVTLLREHRAQQREWKLAAFSWKEGERLFTSKDGTPITAPALQHAWEGIRRRAELEHLHFHDLRHAHVSLLIDAGVDFKVISERVGHTNISTTLNIYGHLRPRRDGEAAALAEAALGFAR